MPDANDLMCHVRQVPDVRATGDATPLLVLTSASGDNEEGHLSTVVVAADDHALEVVERSIRALQSVRDGLLDAGHIDY